MLTYIRDNWKTTAVGVATFLCAGANYLQYIPAQYDSEMKLLCGLLIAMGLVAAQDARKAEPPKA